MAEITEGLLGGFRGKVGNGVFYRRNGSTHVRDRAIPHDPQTDSQRAQRERVGIAARAWSELPDDAAARWESWARAAGTRPMNAFSTLYRTLLRLDPQAAPPLFPPAHAFFGDAPTVAVSPALVPSGAGKPSLTFAASAPNAPGVVTELLVQPLLSMRRRAYGDKYRHAAFVRFAGEPVAAPLPLGTAVVACAYRFVSAETGQTTALAELGKLRLG